MPSSITRQLQILNPDNSNLQPIRRSFNDFLRALDSVPSANPIRRLFVRGFTASRLLRVKQLTEDIEHMKKLLKDTFNEKFLLSHQQIVSDLSLDGSIDGASVTSYASNLTAASSRLMATRCNIEAKIAEEISKIHFFDESRIENFINELNEESYSSHFLSTSNQANNLLPIACLLYVRSARSGNTEQKTKHHEHLVHLVDIILACAEKELNLAFSRDIDVTRRTSVGRDLFPELNRTLTSVETSPPSPIINQLELERQRRLQEQRDLQAEVERQRRLQQEQVQQAEGERQRRLQEERDQATELERQRRLQEQAQPQTSSNTQASQQRQATARLDAQQVRSLADQRFTFRQFEAYWETHRTEFPVGFVARRNGIPEGWTPADSSWVPPRR